MIPFFLKGVGQQRVVRAVHSKPKEANVGQQSQGGGGQQHGGQRGQPTRMARQIDYQH